MGERSSRTWGTASWPCSGPRSSNRITPIGPWVRRAKGFGHEFRMGIGLNSGYVMSGNVGSERRLEYTAIGDTTNTAARLEGMTKGTPYMVFVADTTRQAALDPPADLVSVDRMEVRGRRERVDVWALPDAPDHNGGARKE